MSKFDNNQAALLQALSITFPNNNVQVYIYEAASFDCFNVLNINVQYDVGIERRVKSYRIGQQFEGLRYVDPLKEIFDHFRREIQKDIDAQLAQSLVIDTTDPVKFVTAPSGPITSAIALVVDDKYEVVVPKSPQTIELRTSF
jgi:hypothetical protein